MDRTYIPTTGRTLLVFEDDLRAQHLLRINLEPLGYKLITREGTAGALEAIATYQPDLIILDIKLSDGDGLQVCRRIRADSTVPIIILSAHGQLAHKVQGLEAGADDYVTKPFDPMELAVRIEAVLRRVHVQPPKRISLFQTGDLSIDFEQRLVTKGGVEVPLTRTEYRLLEHLAHYAGRTLVADALVTSVWGQEYSGDYASLHLYISRLRTKLQEDAKQPRYILTRPGVGYMMSIQPVETPVETLIERAR